MEGGAFIWLALYFIPTIVCLARDHHNKAAIIVLNVTTGWTGIGWIIALVWSCTMVKSNQKEE